MGLYGEIYTSRTNFVICLILHWSDKLRSRTSRTKNGRTTFTVGQTTGRSKHYVEQHDVEQQPPHRIIWCFALLGYVFGLQYIYKSTTA